MLMAKRSKDPGQLSPKPLEILETICEINRELLRRREAL